MEKIKTKIPNKYRVGIVVTIPMLNKDHLVKFREIIGIVAEIIGNGINPKELDKTFESNGKAVISGPLIHSIAEMKLEGINDVFEQIEIPIKAFLTDGE